jgi:NAD(P)-dependent dehydrogenase (short-subunit alcohol dehydrogenase family)
MVLDLSKKKVLVIDGIYSGGYALTQAVAAKGADVVIWLRKRHEDAMESKALSVTQVELPEQQSSGTSPVALWRQTILRRSYW